MLAKIKKLVNSIIERFKKDIILFLTVFLISLLSFAVGYIANS